MSAAFLSAFLVIYFLLICSGQHLPAATEGDRERGNGVIKKKGGELQGWSSYKTFHIS